VLKLCPGGNLPCVSSSPASGLFLRVSGNAGLPLLKAEGCQQGPRFAKQVFARCSSLARAAERDTYECCHWRESGLWLGHTASPQPSLAAVLSRTAMVPLGTKLASRGAGEAMDKRTQRTFQFSLFTFAGG